MLLPVQRSARRSQLAPPHSCTESTIAAAGIGTYREGADIALPARIFMDAFLTGVDGLWIRALSDAHCRHFALKGALSRCDIPH